MTLRVKSQPTELITIQEVSNFLKLDFYTNEQSMLEAMITASRQWCEEYLRRSIGVQALELLLDGFPVYGKRSISLRPPFISLTSLKYLDTSNTLQTLVLNTDFVISEDTDPAEIRPISVFPQTLSTANSVQINYIAGYQNGDDSPLISEILPKTIRQAMLMLIADMYENREANVERELKANPTVERLLSQYRLEMGI